MKINHQFGENFYDFYEEKNKTKKTFVLLHGAVSVNSIWDSLIPNIQELGNVHVVSLVGHYPGTVSWDKINTLNKILTLQHDILKKVLEKENNKEIILLGHSIGGTFSILLKALYPETYSKVIAITPVIKEDMGFFSPINIPVNFLSNIKFKENEIWFMQNYFLKKTATHFEDIFLKFVLFFGFYNNNISKDQEIEVLKFKEGIKKQKNDTLQNMVKITKIAVNEYPWLNFLKEKFNLENKAFIIGAREDRLIPVAHHREAAQKIKAKYFEIEKSGHLCVIENKDIIYKEIKVWLNE